MDILDDLPAESRYEVVGAVKATLRVEADAAETIVRASKPLWDAMEEAGGVWVDSWGGMQYVRVFPIMLAALVDAVRPPTLDEVLASLAERESTDQG